MPSSQRGIFILFKYYLQNLDNSKRRSSPSGHPVDREAPQPPELVPNGLDGPVGQGRVGDGAAPSVLLPLGAAKRFSQSSTVNIFKSAGHFLLIQ